MIKILRQIFRTGIVTEPLRPGVEAEVKESCRGLDDSIRKRFSGSLTIRQVDAGSCNGCELEIHAINNSYYNCERFGIHFTASPRFADLLLVTGPVSRNMEIALRRTFDATPPPKLVVACGDCAVNGGIYRGSYAVLDGVASVVPVDCFIPGCPPAPDRILAALLQMTGKKVPDKS
jgi:Ni,Fe-hydrogenase III small subunit